MSNFKLRIRDIATIPKKRCATTALLDYFLIVGLPSRVNNAQKCQIGLTGVFDPLDRVRRYVYGIAGLNRRRLVINMHLACTGYDIINFIGF